MSIPVNHKFACLSFEHMSSFTQAQPIALGAECSVHFRTPIVLDRTWQKWMGTIDVGKLQRSTFSILATSPSANPGIVDHEHQVLEKRVRALWYALLVHGVPDYSGLMSLRGGNVDGDVQVRSRSTLPPSYKPRHAQAAMITPEALTSADSVATGMRRIYAVPVEYARLKRGFMGAWLSGVEERNGDARLHQFVRSIEALIKPHQGKTRRQFVHRAAFFLGGTADNRALLGELFDLRSAAEHLNDFELLLQDIPVGDRERRGWLRSYQAELLADSLYIRLFSSPQLLETFRTDGSIQEFWALGEQERRNLWGPPLDLEGLSRERHSVEPEAPATAMRESLYRG